MSGEAYNANDIYSAEINEWIKGTVLPRARMGHIFLELDMVRVIIFSGRIYVHYHIGLQWLYNQASCGLMFYTMLIVFWSASQVWWVIILKICTAWTQLVFKYLVWGRKDSLLLKYKPRNFTPLTTGSGVYLGRQKYQGVIFIDWDMYSD